MGGGPAHEVFVRVMNTPLPSGPDAKLPFDDTLIKARKGNFLLLMSAESGEERLGLIVDFLQEDNQWSVLVTFDSPSI
jgi:hypothetical protein